MGTKSEKSYRNRFNSVEWAHAYDKYQYSKGTYGDLLWGIEQEYLRKLVDEFRSGHHIVDYLDFATGTGRIVSYMEDLVDTAVGIEISEAMAERASERVKSARILCRDITEPGAPIEGQYDFITAFRFLLNAEPTLRLAGLKALAARLRDESSFLVFNNHGYLWSYRMLAYPVYALRALEKGVSKPNYLTHRDVMRLVAQAGMHIDRVMGCGVFSGKVASMMPVDKALRLEKFAAQSFPLSRFGVNQIYVARLH